MILAAAVLGGCYSYTPAEPAAVPAGSHVRLRAAGGASLDGAPAGLDRDRIVRGRLLHSPTVDTLLFSLAIEPESPTTARRGLRSTVAIPTASVSALEIRRLDRTRTGALVGAGAVLAAVVLDAAFDIRNGREGDDDPGGVDNAVVPLFRFLW